MKAMWRLKSNFKNYRYDSQTFILLFCFLFLPFNKFIDYFSNFQEAKEVLCDPERRKNYDKWRNSGISISYKSWIDMKDHVHQVHTII